MKYEDFEKFIKEKCMYDTIYDDSDGRQVLIIRMLDAYSMVDKALRARLAQPEPAECDGGQCGIGGYCKECPKTKPEPDYEAEFIKDWNEGKVRRVSDGKRMVPEREWVGLTGDERKEIALEVPMDAVCITEAKLKEKNGG